ncbi:AraC family transcriptional regulator [Marinomonas sp. A79]|uniref:AraC family transcriptional regulator n=1 Tax=Marinomonas vulgaris TaxID=2823372 RepID=A0ABS5H9T4_9GAMM|nr:helix-turn-helix domain-containing protein [Marinomonas vulgaris]MBR7888202.1 AraC family transcriptional regulator [Marinomonas vulgaris]
MMFNFTACDVQVLDASAKVMTTFLSDKNFTRYHFLEASPNHMFTLLRFKAFGALSFLEYQTTDAEQINTFASTQDYCLHLVLAGQSQEQGITGRTLQTEECAFVAPGSRFVATDWPHCRKLIVTIPAEFLHQTAREFGYVMTENALALNANAQRFPMAGPLFNLLNDILQQDLTQLGERAKVYYSKLLSTAILSLFTQRPRQQTVSSVSLDRQVQRIHDYVLDHITTDITIEQLVSVCRISRKSLYNVLEREVGVTPTAYIRRLKLEHAHCELKNNTRIKNVTQVALKYGFTNLGRFSAQYREQIGELPSHTLRMGSQ